MRRTLTLCSLLVMTLWVLSDVHRTWAFPNYARQTKAACAACHVKVAGGPDLSDVGKKYKADQTIAVPADVKGADYVGINKCKMCHAKEYKAWQTTPHAKAWAGLVNADPTAAADLAKKLEIELKDKPSATDGCVTCHVVGFHLPGGYPAADSAKTAALINVACEACHGPGSMHVAAKSEDRKKTINRTVTAAMCTQCHTPVTSPKFDFEEFKKIGVHAVAAAAPAPAK